MLKILTVFLGILSINFANAKVVIHDYERLYMPLFTPKGELGIAIRVFKRDEAPSVLVVNPVNLETQVLALSSIYLKNPNTALKLRSISHEEIRQSRYYQLFFEQMQPNNSLENQGIKHALQNISAPILTVDLCPSTRPFEKDFFDELAKLGENKPFPVAISISGLWMIKHPEEFQYLIDLQKNRKLAITWVNHTFSHIYYSDLPESKNFLLSEMVNLDTEILLTEQYLLEENQTPSVFFRFPGLISNPLLLKRLKRYGLIPLGADAWIAKDEAITPGSVVLVHGNGNEHNGILKLQSWLKKFTWTSLPGSV